MGEVFEGWDLTEDRAVAIKRLLPKHASEAGLQARFLREARALMQLQHPRIVPVYAVGKHDGAPYLVMKLLEGQTLAERIRAPEPLPHPQVVAIGAQLLEALAHVHAAGLVHRDVKPANIMLDPNGQTFLLDFGVAKDEDSRLTETGATVGTPQFMAPEQALNPRDATPRSDLYAAGATLFAAWAGRPPFLGATSFEVLKQHHDTPIPRLTTLRPALPESVDRFAQQALAKDPSARFQSAEEMRSTLIALSEARRGGVKRAALGGLLVLAALAGLWATSVEKAKSTVQEPRPSSLPVAPLKPPAKTSTVTPASSPIPKAPPPPVVSPEPVRRARPRRPKPAKARSGPAELRIITLDRGLSTYAQVQIDDLPPKFTPVAHWKVPAGDHVLRVWRKGFITQTVRFSLKSNEQRKLEVILQPAPNPP